ncbi:MAG: GNAT family N-acetyltransferase [Desulfamplus sp.]|nr:GNAT family N-acetyltransferase [Desulfamplus sp.]
MKILNGKYTLRPFTLEDENGVLELWKTAFKSTMSKELFRWKYLKNPYTQTMMLCVTDKDEIVTFYGGIPYLFQYGEKIVPVVNLMDIMSHPMHRENRIFEKTAKQFMAYFCSPLKRDGLASLQESLLLMYGFPGEFHYSIGERILNYRKVNQPLYLTLSLGYSKDKSTPLYKKNRKAEVLNSIEFKNNNWFEQDRLWFDNLWEKCKQDYPFSIIRDSKFVNWRFINHPEKQYSILKIGSSVDGAFVVLQINGSKATIVDMFMSNYSELFKDVIFAIVEYLTAIDSHQEIKYIETWLPENHFLAAHAIEYGFQSQDEPIGIIPTVSLFEHSPTLEWVTSNLYYSMGDGDLL